MTYYLQIISLDLISEKTISIKIVLIFVLFLFGLPIQSQRSDNYKPDNVNVTFEKSNLPIIFIETGGQQILKDSRISAKMKVLNNGGDNMVDTIQYPNQNFDYDGFIGIKYRGNSSFTLSDKKPYSIRLLTESIENNGKKQKASLLGMPAHHDWVLLSLYIDKSMIREALTFTLAKDYLEYVPKASYCEVILDGVYYGVYLLVEHVKRGEGRLDMKKPGNSGDELTGGYFVEIDRNDEPCHTSKYYPVSVDGMTEYTNKPVYFQYKDPELSEMTEEQRNYIDNQIDAFEDALKSPTFKDPNIGYRKYIDVTSFIDYQLTQEVTNNCDAYRLSTKLYKFRDSVDPRFKMTIWDFDRAGGKSKRIGYLTDIWAYQDNRLLTESDDTFVPFWWGRLMEDESYVNELRSRWTEYRLGSYSDYRINEVVDSLVNELTSGGAVERNSAAWPRWGVYQYPEYYVAHDFNDEIAFLKSWIAKRLEWMDDQLHLETASSDLLSYIFQVTSAEWATICVPFSFTIPEGLSVYSITGLQGEKSTLTKEIVVSTTEANKPYLVKGIPGAYLLTGYAVDVEKTAGKNELINGLLMGTYEEKMAPIDSYVLQNQNGKIGFYHVRSDDVKVKSNRAWLVLPESMAHSSGLFFEENITKLSDVGVDSIKKTLSRFSLNGIQQKTTHRGISIVRYENGKVIKVIEK